MSVWRIRLFVGVAAVVCAVAVVVVSCCSRGDGGDALIFQPRPRNEAAEPARGAGKVNDESVPEPRARARAGGATLEVTVHTADATAVAGATVIVLPYDRATGAVNEADAVVMRADADGRAVFADLAPGVNHEVCVRAEGLTPTGRKFIVGGGVRETVVQMRKITRQRVRVVDPEGLAIPGTRVTITRPADVAKAVPGLDRVAEAATDDDGWMEFDLEPSADAKYLAWFDPPRDAAWGLPVVTGVPWVPGDATMIVARGYWIRGVVRSPDGKPLPGVAIRTRGGRGTPLSERTSADGRFSIYGLARGESAGVRAEVRGWAPSSDDVPETDGAPAGADATVWTYLRAGEPPGEVVVDPGSFVVVKLEYEFGVFDRSGLLVWSPRAPDAAPVTIAHNGVGSECVLVGGLDPARSYTFVVGPTWLGRVAVATEVKPSGQTITLEFAPGVATRGVVRTAAAADGTRTATRDVEVAAWTPDEPRMRVASVKTKDDGTFEFPGLAPGRWILRTADVDPWGETEAAAGAEGIVIEMNRSGHRPLRAGGPR